MFIDISMKTYVKIKTFRINKLNNSLSKRMERLFEEVRSWHGSEDDGTNVSTDPGLSGLQQRL